MTACGFKSKSSSAVEGQTFAAIAGKADSVVMPSYAKGYRVKCLSQGVRLLEIQDPQSPESPVYRYALVPRGMDDSKAKEGVPADYVRLEVPIGQAICMTSLQLSNFIRLGACDRVAGITSTRHLFNKEMNERLKAGKTIKIGIEGNFDNELIMSINPDIIFISPFKRGGYDALRETDIPLVPHLGYKELTPLGQAEWIKLVGMFLGMEEKAAQEFGAIEARYKELRQLAEGVKNRPVVFSGEIRGGNWYAVGGRSFLAELFRRLLFTFSFSVRLFFRLVFLFGILVVFRFCPVIFLFGKVKRILELLGFLFVFLLCQTIGCLRKEIIVGFQCLFIFFSGRFCPVRTGVFFQVTFVLLRTQFV